MTTIALYNLKGGVGKTASCVNLAYLAAKNGYRTLLWDIDPQGSASFYFQGKLKLKGGIKKLLSPDTDLREAVLPTDYDNLDLISADLSAKSTGYPDRRIRPIQKETEKYACQFKQGV